MHGTIIILQTCTYCNRFPEFVWQIAFWIILNFFGVNCLMFYLIHFDMFFYSLLRGKNKCKLILFNEFGFELLQLYECGLLKVSKKLEVYYLEINEFYPGCGFMNLFTWKCWKFLGNLQQPEFYSVNIFTIWNIQVCNLKHCMF